MKMQIFIIQLCCDSLVRKYALDIDVVFYQINIYVDPKQYRMDNITVSS